MGWALGWLGIVGLALAAAPPVNSFNGLGQGACSRSGAIAEIENLDLEILTTLADMADYRRRTIYPAFTQASHEFVDQIPRLEHMISPETRELARVYNAGFSQTGRTDETLDGQLKALIERDFASLGPVTVDRHWVDFGALSAGWLGVNYSPTLRIPALTLHLKRHLMDAKGEIKIEFRYDPWTRIIRGLPENATPQDIERLIELNTSPVTGPGQSARRADDLDVSYRFQGARRMGELKEMRLAIENSTAPQGCKARPGY